MAFQFNVTWKVTST